MSIKAEQSEWRDFAAGGTPLNAARLNYERERMQELLEGIENGTLGGTVPGISHLGTYTLQATDIGTIQEIAGGATPNPYAVAVEADNPSSWWRLNETSGTEAKAAAGAISGTYQTITVTGGPATFKLGETVSLTATEAAAKGVYLKGGGNAGTNAAAARFSGNHFQGTTAFTIEAWVFLKGFPTTAGVIFDNLNESTGKYGWQLSYDKPGNIYLYASNGTNGTGVKTSTFKLATETWYHLAVTFNAGTVKIYVNGKEEAVTNLAGGGPPSEVGYTEPPGNASIGSAQGVWEAYGVNAIISDVAYYTTVLSGARVKVHAEGGAVGGEAAVLTVPKSAGKFVVGDWVKVLAVTSPVTFSLASGVTMVPNSSALEPQWSMATLRMRAADQWVKDTP